MPKGLVTGDLCPPELLAQVLGRAADHQPGQDDRDDREHEDVVQPGADAAGRDLPEQHVEQRDRARAAGVAVVQGVGRAGRGPVVDTAKRTDARTPKRTCLPSIAAPAASAARPFGWLGRPGDGEERRPGHVHHGDEHHALAPVADQRPERPGEADRDHEQQEDLEEVRERVRVLERLGGVGVEDAAAVRPELLDGVPSTVVTSMPDFIDITTPPATSRIASSTRAAEVLMPS